MRKDIRQRLEQCEDRLVLISDIAGCGGRLESARISGLVSERISVVCRELFTEIAELAGFEGPANDVDDIDA